MFHDHAERLPVAGLGLPRGCGWTTPVALQSKGSGVRGSAQRMINLPRVRLKIVVEV
jgi:hypothetical protein